jgi:hypothetical protein
LAALNPEDLQAVENLALGKQLTHKRIFFALEQAVESFEAAQT